MKTPALMIVNGKTLHGVVSLQLSVERREVNAEDVGGARLVLVDGGERVEDVAALGFGERGAQAVGVAHGGRLARGVAHARREAVEVNAFAAQSEGALDRVLKLADVAGPVVVGERGQRSPLD